MPGNVKVASKIDKIPTNKTKLIINAELAINPKNLYLYIMNIMTKKKPIIKDIKPALIESLPKSGPTDLSSIIFNGAGKAPDLNNNARSVAD